MNEGVELQHLNHIRDAINLDQSLWEIAPVKSGRVGLVRSRHIDDYVWAEASVELDGDRSQPRFLIRGVVIDCHDPVRLRTAYCSSTAKAAEAATAMLRWVLREAHSIAAKSLDVP